MRTIFDAMKYVFTIAVTLLYVNNVRLSTLLHQYYNDSSELYKTEDVHQRLSVFLQKNHYNLSQEVTTMTNVIGSSQGPIDQSVFYQYELRTPSISDRQTLAQAFINWILYHRTLWND